MNKKEKFLKIFNAAKKHYEKDKKRLAAEGWEHNWQTLIATIMSAQTRDETTIPVAENLYKKYTLKQLAKEDPQKIREVIRKINYNKNKSVYIVQTANILIKDYEGKVPQNMQDLLKLPGVGRKTANLILGECFKKPAICVDTHVHRISNVFKIVQTKTPDETEKELTKIAPKNTWIEINRYFVLWGKEVPGKNPQRLLNHINLTL